MVKNVHRGAATRPRRTSKPSRGGREDRSPGTEAPPHELMVGRMDMLYGDLEPEEFERLLDAAHRLSHKQASRRERAMGDLVIAGAQALWPLAWSIEEVIGDRHAPDAAIDRQAERAARVVRCIGAPAVPVLERLAEDGSRNIVVNEWAQELIFDVLALYGEDMRRACHHGTVLGRARGSRRVWVCELCGAKLGDGESPTDEPTNPGGDRDDAIR